MEEKIKHKRLSKIKDTSKMGRPRKYDIPQTVREIWNTNASKYYYEHREEILEKARLKGLEQKKQATGRVEE